MAIFQDLSLNQLFTMQEQGPHTCVDVRSPSEFNEATIPGSLNIPIFTDEERAIVGTLYKQVGKAEATEKGLEIFSAKLPDFIKRFQAIETPITVFCWRGGMRSKTAATVLELMGIRASRLHGGIRTYRHWVVEKLAEEKFDPTFIVLNGYTGCGKTVLLKKLADKGYPIIDLEGLAGHRGSIFGHIGVEPRKQKKFDSLLIHALEKVKEEPFVFIEGESRRIGNVAMPEFIFEKKQLGKQIVFQLPMEERVKTILEDYEPWKTPELFSEAFEIIRKRVPTDVAKQVEGDLASGNYASVTSLLLENYYDARYDHSVNADGRDFYINAESVEDAFEKLLGLIETQKFFNE